MTPLLLYTWASSKPLNYLMTGSSVVSSVKRKHPTWWRTKLNQNEALCTSGRTAIVITLKTFFNCPLWGLWDWLLSCFSMIFSLDNKDDGSWDFKLCKSSLSCYSKSSWLFSNIRGWRCCLYNCQTLCILWILLLCGSELSSLFLNCTVFWIHRSSEIT